MRFKEISEGVGLVVPGVNTTPDVGPNEIKKQAAKLGLKVDKNGVPVYTMHKKAHKNSDPNKLFNLGVLIFTKSYLFLLKNLEPLISVLITT